MSEPVSIQWFPGHMAKTRRLMTESLPLIDGVAEIIDARIPVSSRNPELDAIIKDKPRIVLMNKADIADENANKKWIAFFKARGTEALPVDCKTGKGLSGFSEPRCCPAGSCQTVSPCRRSEGTGLRPEMRR